ncbi:MAG: SURF1 family protein [Paracoccaceae bacterium]
MRRYLFPLIFGCLGVAVLVALGLWQVQRLAWKEAILADMAARMTADPVPLETLVPDPLTERYRAVSISGRTTGEDLLVLTGKAGVGPGYEVIAVFQTLTGERLMVDLGFITEELRHKLRPGRAMTIVGNLVWPDEQDSFTPDPDLAARLWYARDVASMSQFLQTSPILVVSRTAEGGDPAIVPVPVTTAGVPNNHLNYAITWFSLAVVWAGMTLALAWRIRQGKE